LIVPGKSKAAISLSKIITPDVPDRDRIAGSLDKSTVSQSFEISSRPLLVPARKDPYAAEEARFQAIQRNKYEEMVKIMTAGLGDGVSPKLMN